MSGWSTALLVAGLVSVVVGAFLMIEGTILGDRTLPAAIVATIVGVVLIASRNTVRRQNET